MNEEEHVWRAAFVVRECVVVFQQFVICEGLCTERLLGLPYIARSKDLRARWLYRENVHAYLLLEQCQLLTRIPKPILLNCSPSRVTFVARHRESSERFELCHLNPFLIG